MRRAREGERGAQVLMLLERKKKTPRGNFPFPDHRRPIKQREYSKRRVAIITQRFAKTMAVYSMSVSSAAALDNVCMRLT